jgi:hypothetical protein
MTLAALLQMLKLPFKQLPGMAPAWGVVILALVAAIATSVMGSGKAAVIALGFATVGVVLVVFLLILAKVLNPTSDIAAPTTRRANARARARDEQSLVLANLALSIARAVAYAFIALIVMLVLVVARGQPCRLGMMLGVPRTDCAKPIAAGVHIDRLVDFSGSGCEQGKRVLREVVTDNVTFQGVVDEYVIQARKEIVESTKLSVQYTLDGATVPVDVKWNPDFSDNARWKYPIPVASKPVVVRYSWEQLPKDDDDLFAMVAITSSRAILSLHATAKLPPNKRILSANPKYADRVAKMEGAGCVMSLTTPAKLDCSKPLNNEPNVPMMYPILWDVFAQCQPKRRIRAQATKKPAQQHARANKSCSLATRPSVQPQTFAWS